MLKDVFGSRGLAVSSVGGSPARNQVVQHDALHPIMLKFIRGKYFHIISTLVFVSRFLNSNIIILIHISVTDVFHRRTEGINGSIISLTNIATMQDGECLSKSDPC